HRQREGDCDRRVRGVAALLQDLDPDAGGDSLLRRDGASPPRRDLLVRGEGGRREDEDAEDARENPSHPRNSMFTRFASRLRLTPHAKIRAMKSLCDLELRGKRLFLRVDFNVPLSGGRVTDRTRIEETIPTVRLASESGARVICASHLGKPRGKVKTELSLAPVAAAFAEEFGKPVRFVENSIGPEAEKAAGALEDGEVLLLENLRFHAGEESNDAGFAKSLAALADCYADDAFGAAHRAHASVVGVPDVMPRKAAGLLLEKEVRERSRLLKPERPCAAVLGGAKISGKIEALEALARRADILLIGGGMANHFVRALGLSVGRSLLEEDKVSVAREILDLCKKEGK